VTEVAREMHRLDDLVEWGLTVERGGAPVPTPEAAACESGRQYLSRRQQDRESVERAESEAAEAAAAVHRALLARARDAVVHPARRLVRGESQAIFRASERPAAGVRRPVPPTPSSGHQGSQLRSSCWPSHRERDGERPGRHRRSATRPRTSCCPRRPVLDMGSPANRSNRRGRRHDPIRPPRAQAEASPVAGPIAPPRRRRGAPPHGTEPACSRGAPVPAGRVPPGQPPPTPTVPARWCFRAQPRSPPDPSPRRPGPGTSTSVRGPSAPRPWRPPALPSTGPGPRRRCSGPRWR
jgi:hypothetical protein